MCGLRGSDMDIGRIEFGPRGSKQEKTFAELLEKAATSKVGWGPMSVVDYVTEEVRRQGHDVTKLDGIQRVGWMLNAWAYALSWCEANPRPGIGDVAAIGSFIEREKNEYGFRKCGVRVGSRTCPPPEEVQGRMERLWEHGGNLKPLEFYRELLEIHPFVDGNGRTGKVILNWMNGTLLQPIFPPADFWGTEIRNP